MSRIFIKLVIGILVCVALVGCASDRLFNEANARANKGEVEESLGIYKAALELEPDNAKYRAAYLNARDRFLARLNSDALLAEKSKNFDQASALYRKMLAIDDHNARALSGIAAIKRLEKHDERMKLARLEFSKGNIDAAEAHIRAILSENPEYVDALKMKVQIESERARPGQVTEARLAEAFRRPISIEFRDAQLRQVFDVLSRSSGLNFVLDKDVRGEQKTTILLRNSSVAEALSLVLLTNQLDYRVLNSVSVLVFPNTAAKAREYEPLSVKSFVLNTGDAKTVAGTIKSILKTKDIVVDEKQNAIIMRDSPEAIRMAEKLVALADRPEPEVMLDVEILEIKRSRLLDLGIQYPSQLSLTPLSATDGAALKLSDLQNLGSGNIGVSVNPMTISAQTTASDINVLANPRIRARNREKAKIQVGQRLPNITSTSTATGFVAETVQYVDVGLKLEVDSTISTDDEVAINIALEVSNITDKLTTKNGSTVYEIGTRNTSTSLRLRDGENQILAGLINNEERSSGNRIPGFGDLPVLGRLFGANHDEAIKSEIVLSITPHIVRGARRPDSNISEFDTGTEANINAKLGGFLPPLDTRGKISSSGGQKNENGADSAIPDIAPPALPTRSGGEGAVGGSDMPRERGALSGKPANSTVATLSWDGDARFEKNSKVSTSLLIDLPSSVASVPFVISYDPKVLELVALTPGNFVSERETTAAFNTRVDRVGGVIRGVMNSIGKEGFVGRGVLLNLEFRPIAPSGDTRVWVVEPVVAAGPGGESVAINVVGQKVLSIK